jgi:hypothetical protein
MPDKIQENMSRMRLCALGQRFDACGHSQLVDNFETVFFNDRVS